MKGIIFTEFLDFVESKFGLEIVDQIIERSDISSEGIYTSVGTYDFNEIVTLLTSLESEVSIPADRLTYIFGLYLFTSLVKTYPEIIQNYNCPIDFLYGVENHIHVHVKKLIPDAELPTFKILEKTASSISMIYSSSRGLYRLAHGLMVKTFEHYNVSANISYELIKDDGTEVKFDIAQDG
jgi:hypothetical protein